MALFHVRRSVLLAACTLMASASSFAAAEPAPVPTRGERPAYGAWTSSRIDGGGFIMGVRFTEADSDRLWTYTDVGGAYRSDDAGDSWRHVTYTLPYGGSDDRGMAYVRDMVGDPDDPDRAIILIGYTWSPDYGLYVTDDAGQNWKHVQDVWAVGDAPDRMYGRALVRSASDPTVLYAAGRNQGIFRSTDNGETWTFQGGPKVEPADLMVHRDDPDTLWLTANAFASNVREGEIEGNELSLPPGLWKSTDAGKSWEQLRDDSSLELLQDPNNADVLYGIFDDGYDLARSTDGGKTWQRFMDGLPTEPQGDRNWNPVAWRYFGLTAGPDFVLATAADGTVHKLSGDRWQRIGPDKIVEPENWFGYTDEDAATWADWSNSTNSATGVYPHPADPQNTWWMTDWFSVYRSTDAGKTWVNQTNGIEVLYVYEVETHPTDPTIVHMGAADMGYFRSTDAGEHFIKPKREPITNNIKAVAVSAADADRAYAIGPKPGEWSWYGGHVFRSDDGGKTWTPSPMTGLPPIASAKHHANTLVASDTDADTLYLGVSLAMNDGGGLYVSRDGGDTWTRDSDGIDVSGEFYDHENWRSGPQVALGKGGRQVTGSALAREVFVRDAAGESWRSIGYPFGGDLQHLAGDFHEPGRFWAAVKSDGVYRSDDGGETWTKLETPSVAPGASHLILDRHTPGRIAVGTTNGVIYSSDGGERWTSLDRSLPGRVNWNCGAFAKSEDGRDRLVVGSGGTGLFWMNLPDTAAE